MTQPDLPEPAFFDRADAIIVLANEQCEQADASEVGASFMFAVSRFHAFLVASGVKTRAEMVAEREAALGFFLEQFRSMLEQNLDDYIDNFDSYARESDS